VRKKINARTVRCKESGLQMPPRAPLQLTEEGGPLHESMKIPRESRWSEGCHACSLGHRMTALKALPDIAVDKAQECENRNFLN
jgi:hypothetical protein